LLTAPDDACSDGADPCAGSRAHELQHSDAQFSRSEACPELSGCRHRYHSAMSRTVYLGKPPQKMLDVAKATGEGLEAALETVRPGILCEDVDAAWKTTIARYGLEKPSRIGYSIGLNYPPNWADHTASLRAGRQNGAGAEHDVPPDARHVDGRMGIRNE
jgi:ectoine hydrolase